MAVLPQKSKPVRERPAGAFLAEPVPAALPWQLQSTVSPIDVKEWRKSEWTGQFLVRRPPQGLVDSNASAFSLMLASSDARRAELARSCVPPIVPTEFILKKKGLASIRSTLNASSLLLAQKSSTLNFVSTGYSSTSTNHLESETKRTGRDILLTALTKTSPTLLRGNPVAPAWISRPFPETMND